MRFLGKYSNGTTLYYKTIWGDDVNEATRQAKKWARKGFMLISVVQQL